MEDGPLPAPEPITYEPGRHEAVVLGFRLERLLSGALTHRGHPVPLLRMQVSTTAGHVTFYMTRDEANQFANAMIECALDA